jgi:hypothetical protein
MYTGKYGCYFCVLVYVFTCVLLHRNFSAIPCVGRIIYFGAAGDVFLRLRGETLAGGDFVGDENVKGV